MKYPQRAKIVDPKGKLFAGKLEMRTPNISKPHIGKEGLAEKIGRLVRITLDDGNIIWGHECWWKPLGKP